MVHLLVALLLQHAPSASDSLTLDTALRYARERRAELAVAGGRVDVARAAQRLAARPPNPTLDVSAVAADDSRRVALVQPLGALVRMRFDVGAASAQLEAARADSAQRVANLDRDVARAFFGSLAAGARVRHLRELTTLADSLGILAGRRAQLGDISELDREHFMLEGTRARLQLSRALEDEQVHAAALVRALAWSGQSAPHPTGSLTTGLDANDTATVDPSALPQVRQARATAMAAARMRSALQWARLPIPGLLVQHDWSRTPGFITSTRIGFSLPIPLFSQGNEALGVAAGQARQADAQAAEVELEVVRAIHASQARVREAGRRTHLAADTLLAGVIRLREGALRLYDAGRTSVLLVIDALRAERDAQLVTIDEQLALQEARADLFALLGRSLVPTTREAR